MEHFGRLCILVHKIGAVFFRKSGNNVIENCSRTNGGFEQKASIITDVSNWIEVYLTFDESCITFVCLSRFLFCNASAMSYRVMVVFCFVLVVVVYRKGLQCKCICYVQLLSKVCRNYHNQGCHCLVLVQVNCCCRQ